VTMRQEFEAIIALVAALLIPEDRERWHRLCEDREDPVPPFLFPRIVDYLLQVVEPEFALTLPTATARFNRRVTEHLKHLGQLGRRLERFERRLDGRPHPWRGAQRRRPGRTRRRAGTARSTRAGPSRSPDDPHPLARPDGLFRVPGGRP
jgi:hypothetical protein